MKRVLLISVLVLVTAGIGYTFYYLFAKSQEDPIVYETQTTSYESIVSKTVATGSIKPREEVDIKPQVSGIIQTLYVEAGESVKEGDQIAKIKVIPDMISLNNAENRLEIARLNVENANQDFARQEKLYEQKVISISEFQDARLRYENARQELRTAEDNLKIVKEGTAKSGKTSLTIVRSTVEGMILDVPIKVGNQVIESNNFNDGTTVATVANMGDMIFEGLIDESEVGKIHEGMDLIITIGAIEDQTFKATLEYISPKGTEQNGAIQFQIRARVSLNEDFFIRAGYSANADIVLASRDSVLSVKESLLQFDGPQAFVEVQTAPQKFERRDVQLGLSDGITVEVLSGITEEDQIKVWNR